MAAPSKISYNFRRSCAGRSTRPLGAQLLPNLTRKRWTIHRQMRACAIRVMYLDLVYQWRQIADEFEVLERAKLKGADGRA